MSAVTAAPAANPVKMTDRQRAVWERLEQYHRGRDRGITWQDLAERLAIPNRRLREAVNVLVVQHGLPVGSHPRHGVYVCVDRTDFRLAWQCLHDESVPTLRRLDAIRRLQRVHQVNTEGLGVQASLFEGMG